MKISVILAHPDPGSFNHVIAQTAVEQLEQNGHSVFFHDLYGEGFDPLLTAEEILEDASLPHALQAVARRGQDHDRLNLSKERRQRENSQSRMMPS